MGGGGFWGQIPPKGGAVKGGPVGAASCRVAARVSRARAGGEDAVQGRVAVRNRRQHCRAVAMGAGAACIAPCPGPHGTSRGRQQGERDKA
jgi:hypothetical protein